MSSEAGVQIALLHFYPSKTSSSAQQPATPGERLTTVQLGVNGNRSSSASQQQLRSHFRGRLRDSQMSLANEALAGFQKGHAYDQNRPSYLPEVVDKLLRVLHISGVARAEVLDLAAGTGKFTELLAKQDEQFQITAVEPHHDMRNELDKKHLSNVKVLDGLATKIPLADDSVDAVVVAQVRFSNQPHYAFFPLCLSGFISLLFFFCAPVSGGTKHQCNLKTVPLLGNGSIHVVGNVRGPSLACLRKHPGTGILWLPVRQW